MFYETLDFLNKNLFLNDFKTFQEKTTFLEARGPATGAFFQGRKWFSEKKKSIFLGKNILQIVDNLFKRIPILRTIYSAIVQLTDSFRNQEGSKKSVVLVEYPRKGSWAVGFATKENKGELRDKTNKELINVFVPTTPNPTSGFLLMFPKEDVIYLDMGFEEASKFIVSAGTSSGKV